MQAKELLKQFNLRATNDRIAVVDVFLSKPYPQTLNGIKRKLSDTDPVTVYRAINDFLENKLIHNVLISGDSDYYELTTTQHHHHITCTSCNKIVDISSCDIAPLEASIQKLSKFRSIQSHSLEFFGTCNECV